jgi:hypothetical protein
MRYNAEQVHGVELQEDQPFLRHYLCNHSSLGAVGGGYIKVT